MLGTFPQANEGLCFIQKHYDFCLHMCIFTQLNTHYFASVFLFLQFIFLFFIVLVYVNLRLHLVLEI